ncbi:protein ENHANCED DOWNY MILDEW 2-like [Syzygium oleosum]|uniref:protein ENHANCED DOWNY MILDEW 2-like n=1 Tax=Syzygium oleosum TaxID=219896 RepID=UPI0024BB0AC7|nr:protein ENHANCED DOWNY MILDEW 2-like [Syzygium oleosum]
MASSSDHDAETSSETVSTYYFEDHDNKPISFSVLPVSWSDREDCEDAAAETIFLHGTADNGLRKIYREVKSWRFDLSCSRPEVSVLSKDNICFKLDKPRRRFQDTIRTVLITLHCLHYAKNHPDASGEALWEHLARTLGFYEVQPSAKDLQDHVALIEEAIGRDDALAKSKIFKCENCINKKVNISSGQDIAKKAKATDASKKFHEDTAKSRFLEPSTSLTMREHTSPGERLYSFMTKASTQIKPGKQVVPDSEERRAVQPASKKSDDSLPALHADTERRLLNLMKEAVSSVSMEDVIREQKVPLTHAQYLKSTVDKAITIEEVDGSVQALRAALQRLEEGDSIEDAKAVCDPNVLTQIFTWKDKLREYLAPFVYGMRYTSFGRHFTKVDKLQEIVDKLHWYVRDGDMIVDFCCGANDFSCLMAKKLEETGKKCSYKNYDIFPPKNYFEFELRDWMTVQLKELPLGSNLIMGLNPPFGVRAALANKFIDKALEFKPKLLILIVPSETERLDEKMFRYDLVWEDDRFLSGKSFYLPGSIDVEDKQIEQWKNKPPLLYLWSRRDWTAKHRTIAQKQGDLPTKRKRPLSSDDCNGSLDLRYPKDDRSLCVGTSSLTSDTSMPKGKPEETKDRVDTAEGQKGCFSRNDSGRESRESQATGTSTGKANDLGTSGTEIYEKSPAKETPHHPSLKLTDGKLSFDDWSSKQKADASGTRRREIGEKDQPGPSTSTYGLPGSIAESSQQANMSAME